MNTLQKNSGRCSCGSVTFKTTERPILRAFCHCTICQKFNNADFADVTAYHAKSVESIDESKIEFKVYKQPPLVRRGICVQCGKPAFEKINIPLLPKLIIIPSNNIDDAELLPSPSMHIFYDKRVNDIDDELRKYRGFVLSQIAFSIGLVKSIISRT